MGAAHKTQKTKCPATVQMRTFQEGARDPTDKLSPWGLQPHPDTLTTFWHLVDTYRLLLTHCRVETRHLSLTSGFCRTHVCVNGDVPNC